jgi:hypothetical protein
VQSAPHVGLGVPYRHPETDTSILNRLLEILRAPVPKDVISCGYYQDRMSLAQKLVSYPPGIIAIVFSLALA